MWHLHVRTNQSDNIKILAFQYDLVPGHIPDSYKCQDFERNPITHLMLAAQDLVMQHKKEGFLVEFCNLIDIREFDSCMSLFR